MKMDGEISAGGYIVCHRNVGIMIPGDLAAKIKPQSRALSFPGRFIPCPVKFLKYFCFLCIGDPNALINYIHQHILPWSIQFANDRLFFGRIFNCILNKVADQQLE